MSERENDDEKLFLVFGGRLKSLEAAAFEDVESLDVVGFFRDYDSALEAWRSASQRAVDDAHARYFILSLRSLLDSGTR